MTIGEASRISSRKKPGITRGHMDSEDHLCKHGGDLLYHHRKYGTLVPDPRWSRHQDTKAVLTPREQIALMGLAHQLLGMR